MSLGLFGADLIERASAMFRELSMLPLDVRVATLNALRAELHR